MTKNDYDDYDDKDDDDDEANRGDCCLDVRLYSC